MSATTVTTIVRKYDLRSQVLFRERPATLGLRVVSQRRCGARRVRPATLGLRVVSERRCGATHKRMRELAKSRYTPATDAVSFFNEMQDRPLSLIG